MELYELGKDEDWLYNEYIEKNRTVKDIAKELKTSAATTERILNKNGFRKNNIRAHKIDYRNKDWLYHQYIELDKSANQIAMGQNVIDSTIRVWLGKFDIKKYDDKLYRNKEWLKNQYITLKKSALKISKICKCDDVTILTWLRKFNTPIRKHEGENHANWNGGLRSYSGYIQLLKPDHPHTNGKGYVYKHRLVMEKYIGRYLKPEERVHHLDGNKVNNNIENLSLCENWGKHNKIHGDFQRIAYELVKLGVIKFNRKNNTFFIDKSKLIEGFM